MKTYQVFFPAGPLKGTVNTFIIPANSSKEALEKSEKFGLNGIIIGTPVQMNKDW